jgi:hypothetical protein
MTADKISVRLMVAKDSTSAPRGVDEIEEVFVAGSLFKHPVDAKFSGPCSYGKRG